MREPHEEGGDEGRALKRADFTAPSAPPASRRQGAAEFDLEQAAFALSVHELRELPPAGAPEIAFAGRSNAGKSSVINTLIGKRRMAFVSKRPGRTQLINFFALGKHAFLVDLPGYGYAGVPDALRAHWEHLVGSYVASRPSLAAVAVVMDARHPLTALDQHLLEWLRAAKRPAHVLLTKADKLSKQSAARTLASVRAQIATRWPGTTVQLFSSAKREGVEAAARTFARLAGLKNKSPG